jgi:DNA mismatch endonuclease (patch repair protein)
MQATRQRDTAAEVVVRRLLHARGLRFRVHRQLLPELRRRADIVFASARVAVFVDGCFWHSCPLHRTSPRANREWWAEKLAQNRRRDEDTNRRLQAAGWLVVRIWEHEAPAAAAARIARAVRRRLRRRLA